MLIKYSDDVNKLKEKLQRVHRQANSTSKKLMETLRRKRFRAVKTPTWSQRAQRRKAQMNSEFQKNQEFRRALRRYQRTGQAYGNAKIAKKRRVARCLQKEQ